MMILVGNIVTFNPKDGCMGFRYFIAARDGMQCLDRIPRLTFAQVQHALGLMQDHHLIENYSRHNNEFKVYFTRLVYIFFRLENGYWNVSRVS